MDPEPIDAKPFVRWAGGKSQLLPKLREHVPERFGRYIEPFVGAGAMFFDLYAHGRIRTRGGAVLSDANHRLIATYQGVKQDVDNVIRILKVYAAGYAEGGRDYYTARRAKAPGVGLTQTAAWTIFMLKAGWNGVWRENRKGIYNVPPGKFRTPPTICDVDALRACAAALKHVTLLAGDFEKASARARRGDFWYADPPYVPMSATADFTAYTKDPFGPIAQERLRDLALRLKKKGVHVLLSNSDTPFVRKLYRRGFELQRVHARRSVNSATAKRGPVRELLIW